MTASFVVDLSLWTIRRTHVDPCADRIPGYQKAGRIDMSLLASGPGWLTSALDRPEVREIPMNLLCLCSLREKKLHAPSKTEKTNLLEKRDSLCSEFDVGIDADSDDNGDEVQSTFRLFRLVKLSPHVGVFARCVALVSSASGLFSSQVGRWIEREKNEVESIKETRRDGRQG